MASASPWAEVVLGAASTAAGTFESDALGSETNEVLLQSLPCRMTPRSHGQSGGQDDVLLRTGTATESFLQLGSGLRFSVLPLAHYNLPQALWLWSKGEGLRDMAGFPHLIFFIIFA